MYTLFILCVTFSSITDLLVSQYEVNKVVGRMPVLVHRSSSFKTRDGQSDLQSNAIIL